MRGNWYLIDGPKSRPIASKQPTAGLATMPYRVAADVRVRDVAKIVKPGIVQEGETKVEQHKRRAKETGVQVLQLVFERG